MELGETINKVAHQFPKDEIYNLSSQIRRAADSIALNISEKEYIQQYTYSFNLINMLVAFKDKIR